MAIAADTRSTHTLSVARTRRAYFAITLLLFGIVAWGFSRYYSGLFTGGMDRPWLVHLHAAVFSIWIIVLVTQAALVVAGNVRLHRQIGNAAMLYGVLVFVVGVAVSIGAPALRVREGQFALEVGGMVALYSLADLLLFGVFLAFAYAYRDIAELHKRWIISATAALAGAALGRPLASDSPEYLAMWLSPILAMLCIDLATRRRVHFITLVAGALIVVAFYKVPLFAAVPNARVLGAWLVQPFL